MTLLIVCGHCPTQADMESVVITVSQNAASTGGTSACLREGDILTVFDLVHGMMLPSGNDAAMMLAETFGAEGEIDDFVN